MRFFLSLFFIFIFHSVNSQTKNYFSIQSSLTKMDVFTGLNYEREGLKKLNAFSSLELGLIKTVFQKRIFPRATLGISYSLFKKGDFCFSPEISYSLSGLKIDENHYWNEYYIGYKAIFGNRIQFYQSTKIGLMNEVFQSELLNKRQSVNCFGYNIAIGLRYEI
jgi:hypothetical protein